ncbi:MAG: insulinase family protein [Candidatus Aminicenantes bacterium]|nr:insulinase family protein [Candidatus Aminicenantes bacterium]
MKRFVLTTIIFVFACVSVLQAGIFPFKIHEKTLDNGFKIIAIPLSNPGIVAYYSVVRTGSRDEYEEGHTGFAHFFEHMMFRGTKKFPSNVYDRITTEIGADTNAYTSDDITAYHLEFAKEDLEQVMDLESNRFQELDYKEQAFKTEAGAVFGEYLKSKMNPWRILYNNLYFTAFDKHTYKHTTLGFEKDIIAMPTMYEYSKSFFNRYYRPKNVVLMIVGDIVPEDVFKLAEKYYGKWEQGYVPPKITEEPEQQGPRAKKVDFKGRTLPMLAVAYKSLKFMPGSKDYVASNILGDIMFGFTSDLYSQLVLKEQKVQTLYGDFSMNRDPNLNTVIALVKKKEDVDYVKEEIEKTLQEYRTELMDKKKLDDLKSNLKYSFLMRLNSAARVAGSFTRFIALTGGIEAIDRYYLTLETITPEDIKAAAAKYFSDNRKTEILLLGE